MNDLKNLKISIFSRSKISFPAPEICVKEFFFVRRKILLKEKRAIKTAESCVKATIWNGIIKKYACWLCCDLIICLFNAANSRQKVGHEALFLVSQE